MTSFDVMELFAAQLRRNVGAKVVITPSSVDEKGVTVRVSLLKTFLNSAAPASRNVRTARIRVQVSGTAESMSGLRQAVEAIEAVDRYLTLPRNLERLERQELPPPMDGVETERAVPIPNTRVLQQVSEEDSFVDSPDSTEVQDVDDTRIVTIDFPA